VNRQEFITLLGGAAMASPVVARAQQLDRMRRVGVLTHSVSNESEAQVRLAAFVHALQR
jgi:putative ABC transport system substrate-binding protein